MIEGPPLPSQGHTGVMAVTAAGEQQKIKTRQRTTPPPPDRGAESLPDSTWTGQAIELFADELHDLELLEKEEEKLHQIQMQCLREHALEAALVRPQSGDLSLGTQEKRSGSRAKQNTLLHKRNAADKPHVHQALSGNNKYAFSSVPAQNTLRTSKEEEGELAATRRRDMELWQRSLQVLKQEMQSAREESELWRAFTRRQLRFFTARNIDEYTMDEILQSAAEVPAKTRCNLTHVVTEDLCSKEGGEEEERLQSGSLDKLSRSAPSSLAPPPATTTTTTRMAPCGGTGEGVNNLECDNIINAFDFCSSINAKLEKEYGFCPFTTSFPGRRETTRAVLSQDEMREKLFLHAPGDIMGLKEPCSSWMLPPAPPPANKVLQIQRHGSHSSTNKSNDRGEHTKGVSLPPISTRGGVLDVNAAAAAAAEEEEEEEVVVAKEGNCRGDFCLQSTPTRDANRSRSRGNIACIECTAAGNHVTLQTTVGVKTNATVRFINRDPRLLRLRVRPSNHPWLTYSIVKSSLGAPPPSSSGVCTTLIEPLRSGGFVDVRITFEPRNMAEPSFSAVLQLGHCREVNSCSGEGAKWHFFDVVVNCDTVLPDLRLIPATTEEKQELDDEGGNTGISPRPRPRAIALASAAAAKTKKSGFSSSSNSGSGDKTRKNNDGSRVNKSEYGIEKFEFPYTFVMDSCKRRFYLENMGSSAVVRLSSSSPHFTIDPSPEAGDILLPCGDRMEITICFAPLQETRCEAEELLITARDVNDGSIISTHRFGLAGEGVLPRIELVRIGTLELELPSSPSSPHYWQDGNTLEEEKVKRLWVPKYLVPDTAPGAETEMQVVVRNGSPIAMPYYWRTDVFGGDSVVKLHVTPATGIFLPHMDTSFRVCMQPSAAQPIAAVLNLFLEDLPTPLFSAEGTLLWPSLSSSQSFSDDLAVKALALYSRSRQIPVLPDHNQLDQMSDPYNVFEHCTQLQPEDCRGVFASGFYLFADPMPPPLVIIPDRLEEIVECLVHQNNTRRITLQNKSSRLLHFFFDPTPTECPSEVQLSTSRSREGVEVKFQPRKGSVPPHGAVTVTFSFILWASGPHSVSIDCCIPELIELMASTHRATGAKKLRCTHQLHLSVTGVGPSVRASTDVLDFGPIALGGEAKASFTVTNNNPISVAFNLQDPMMREPPRFVFPSPPFHLGPGESVEVTVCRQAVDLEELQTFFELVVQGGGTLAIETYATIQAPTLVLQEPVVNFGVVPDGVCLEQNFVLSNASAFDIPYVVEMVTLPPCVQVCVPPPGLVPAGHHGVCIPVRCVFYYNGGGGSGGNDSSSSSSSEYKAVLCVKNARTQQEILVELKCESVSRLAVALDLIPIPKMTEGTSVMVHAPPVLPSVIPSPPVMEVACYIDSLLWNLVNLWVLNNDDHNGKGEDSTNASAGRVHVAEESLLILRPYCQHLVLKAQLPDREPVWSELMGLRVSNLSGCHSCYAMKGLCYGVNDENSDLKEMLASVMSGTKSNLGTSARLHRHAEKKNCNVAVAAGTVGTVTTVTTTNNNNNNNNNTRARGCKRSKEVMLRSTNQPSFWCKTVDGTEQQERKRRAALVGAQELLLSGRGCATTFGALQAGLLHPHAAPIVPVSLLANLPGRYEEKLLVCCGDLPPTQIQVTLELTGKPVLLDSSTAGHTVLDGKEILLMPAVIAGVGLSRRTMALANRVPRDLNVSVRIFKSTATFSVVAVDEDVAAGAVTLRLQSISEEEQGCESAGQGRVAAAPETFLLPAMASREVTIEYAPDAEFLTGEGTEREWHGGVIIMAVVADTTFNDGFLIDEFYCIHAARYPAQRVIKTKRIREKDPAWMKSTVRPVTALKVQQSVISRPRVVHNNQIVPPTDSEVAAMGNSLEASGLCSSGKRQLEAQWDKCKMTTSEGGGDAVAVADAHEDEDEDEEDDDDADMLGTYHHQGRISSRPLEEILADEEERKALRAFMVQRRLEVAEYSQRYFIPIELELRARCGAPRLAVEPSGDVLCFPAHVEGRPCRQSVLLTNASCAMMEFVLEVTTTTTTTPLFRILKTRFISSNIEHDGMSVKEDETAVMSQRRGLSGRRKKQTERRGAERSVSPGRCRQTANAAVAEVTLPRISPTFSPFTATGNGRVLSYDDDDDDDDDDEEEEGDPFVTATKYKLRPHDALEVLLEYCGPSTEEADATVDCRGTAEANLDILYIPTIGLTSVVGEPKGDHNKERLSKRRYAGTVSPPPVPELKQSIPLSVTLSPPLVDCTQSMLWFRPGQLIHDGRPQPSYAQKLQLRNFSSSAVHFRIVPASCDVRTLPQTTDTVKEFTTLAGTIASSVCDRNGARRSVARLLTREQQLHNLTRYWDIGGCSGGDDVMADGPIAEVQGEVGPTQPNRHPQQEHREEEEEEEKQQPEALVVVDASRFVVTPSEGIIPAATHGGRPGVFEVAVWFNEYGDVCFMAVFDVLINNHVDSMCSFTVRGDSRETEI